MWPSKQHLGVQLAYGLYGNGIVVPEDGSLSLEDLPSLKPQIQFPRLRDQGPKLRPIENSEWLLPTTLASLLPQLSRSMAWFRKRSHSTIYAPDLITAALASELAPIIDNIGHDPTKGDITASLDLGIGAFADPIVVGGQRCLPKVKNGILHIKGVAYVCGDENTDLFVAPLLPKKHIIIDLDTEKEEESLFPNALVEPKYACCRFLTTISQIQPSPTFPIIAVRCKTQIYFAKFLWLNDPDEKGISLEILPISINCADVGGEEFSHVQFSPCNKNEVAVIDQRGHISIYALYYDQEWTIELLSNSSMSGVEEGAKSLSIYDPEELSAWKNVIWTPDACSIIAFSRREARLFYLEKSEALESHQIVTANLWAQIWDVKTCQGYVFLLTSMEIIFLKFDEKHILKRLVSWKHFLDKENSTFRLKVCEGGLQDLFICSVYSKDMPIAMIYTFGFHDGKAVLLRDPYCIETRGDCLDFFVNRLPYNEKSDLVFYTLELSKNACRFAVFHGNRSLKLNNPQFKISSSDLEKDASRSNVFEFISKVEASNAFRSFSVLSRMTHENDEIWDDSATVKANNQIQIVQNYASRLGHDIKKRLKISDDDNIDVSSQNIMDDVSYIPRFSPLSSIADCVPVTISDMEEFDSMVDQLAEFYDTCGIELNNDIREYFEELNLANEQVQALQNSLKQVFPQHPNATQAAMILASSLLKVSNYDIESRLHYMYRQEVQSCDAELSAMFDEWDILTTRERPKSAPPTMDTKKRGLLHRALTQNSQQYHSTQASQVSQVSQTSQASSNSIPYGTRSQTNPSQGASSHPAPPLVTSSQNTVKKSQPLKRVGSQASSQKKKKKKGGFA